MNAKSAVLGIKDIGLDEGAFSGGQLKAASKNKNDQAKTFFILGRTAAKLEQQREELKKASDMTIMQRLMLSDAELKIKELLHALALRSDEMSMKADRMATNQYPPLPNAYPPLPGGGGFPPLPEDMGYAPQDQGQMGEMGFGGPPMGPGGPPQDFGPPMQVPMG